MILSQALIIVISVTSGIFIIVLILLIICCILTCGSDETKEASADREKFPLTEAEKAKVIRNPVQQVVRGNSGIQNGGVVRDDVFYPNGVATTVPSKPVQNGGVRVPLQVVPVNGTTYIPQNPSPAQSGSYLQPRLIPINSDSTNYVPPDPPPSYQNGRTYYVPPKDDSGPRFKHKTPPSILANVPRTNYRYLRDGEYRYVVNDRPRIEPLRRTRSYGDHWFLYDDDDHRRRRRKRHRKRRTRSLGVSDGEHVQKSLRDENISSHCGKFELMFLSVSCGEFWAFHPLPYPAPTSDKRSAPLMESNAHIHVILFIVMEILPSSPPPKKRN